jgi:hypothetical protein
MRAYPKTVWEKGTVPFFSPTILPTVPDRKIATVPDSFRIGF